MTKKKRELIEILLDNVKPEYWPENLPYAAQDKIDGNVWSYEVEPIVSCTLDDQYASDGFSAKLILESVRVCKHWNKTIVHRDEFMKRWNERNPAVEVKTPQQLALEKFGTDWHENNGAQPVDDDVLVDVVFCSETTILDCDPVSFRWLKEGKLGDIKKWRIHSDKKESQSDLAVKSLSDGPQRLNSVLPTEQQEFYGFKKAAESMGGYTDRGSIELARKPESGIEKVIADRGINYGRFEDGAEIMQHLKLIAHTSQGWERMKPIQREGMDMILHKIGRILNGDPSYVDSWIDIEGYSKLVSDWLKGTSK